MKTFLSALQRTPPGPVFNPWFATDQEHDQSDAGPRIRQAQLEAYFRERQNSTRFLLLGEALGYQGGHFTGIAMTSERLLMGQQKDKGIKPDMVFTSIKPQRTSKPERKANGFVEPTATIVWSRLLDLGMDPFQFAIWNAFPWHPYKPEKGLLSNRTPGPGEMQAGLAALKALRKYLQHPTIIAIGKKAGEQLKRLGIDAAEVRHPANGGAGKFREQIAHLLGAC